jgi:sec-independent protein translocase protein TatA
MFGLSPTELLVIGGIVVLIFGAKKLPEIGKGLGGAIREFKKVKKDITMGGKKEDEREQGGGEKSLENKAVQKIIEEVPVVRKGMAIKKKAEKIKKIMN